MPHRDPHDHGILEQYFKNKELDSLYLSVALKAFAGSFIAIFIPIYLLNLGFSIPNIALYYLVLFSTAFLFFPLGMKSNSILGIKKTMALGIFILIAYYLLLNSLESGNINYLFIASVMGISTAFYWAGFHMEFSIFCDKKKEASETSMINIFQKLAGALGPLLGAIFISTISFSFLFLLVSGLLLFSVIPLFLRKDHKIKYKFSVKGILSADIKEKAIAYEVSAILGIVSAIFWPIFIYLTLKEVFSLGIIVSVVAVIEIVFLFFIGKLSDKYKKKMLKLGILSHSFSWLTRLMFLSPIGIFFNNLYSSLSGSMINLPFSKIIYEKSKKVKDSANYFLFREFHLIIGRILILSMVILTASIFWTFVISFFITFVYFVLLKKPKYN